MARFTAVFRAPVRDVVLIALLALALLAGVFRADATASLAVIAALGTLPTLADAVAALRKGRVGIDAFNVFAVAISFATGEFGSAAFIALMLSFARLLDWRTESRAHDAIEELLKLKPLKAVREQGGVLAEIPVDDIRKGDLLLVASGSRVPADGRIVFGEAHFNESSVTGESALVAKTVGDAAVSGTLLDAGAVKIEVTAVGRESTLERMAELMKEAAKNKSRTEKQADRFAGMFLPLVAALGIGTYLVTGDVTKTAALFLIACADDMAVAIPLAMTASLGAAAKRGVIIKGGEWLDALRRVNVVVLDKTGTLTYGELVIHEVQHEPWIGEEEFLRLLAVTEKFSEHPVGKAVARDVAKRFGPVPDPDAFRTHKGVGVWAKVGAREVAAGNERIAESIGLPLPDGAMTKLAGKREQHGSTTVMVLIDGRFAGLVTVADVPRTEAAEAVQQLQSLGLRVIMLTGDDERTAADVAQRLGITEYRASMRPEDKLAQLEELSKQHRIAMVGDGINDAPSLARADVGIAMGGKGAAVSVQAADVVIMTDDLRRLPEMIELGRRTMRVINNDVIIWVVTNVVGFALVFGGLVGPAVAAAYNFLTDFLPLINSSLLFRRTRRSKT